MFPNADDLPLFSGTPVPGKTETYKPEPQPNQDSLFDLRLYITRPIKPQPVQDCDYAFDWYEVLDPACEIENRQQLEDLE